MEVENLVDSFYSETFDVISMPSKAFKFSTELISEPVDKDNISVRINGSYLHNDCWSIEGDELSIELEDSINNGPSCSVEVSYEMEPEAYLKNVVAGRSYRLYQLAAVAVDYLGPFVFDRIEMWGSPRMVETKTIQLLRQYAASNFLDSDIDKLYKEIQDTHKSVRKSIGRGNIPIQRNLMDQDEWTENRDMFVSTIKDFRDITFENLEESYGPGEFFKVNIDRVDPLTGLG